MAVAVEIINPELWGHLLGEFGREPDSRTQRINHEMHNAFEAGFGAFARFHERLEFSDAQTVRKYMACMPDPNSRGEHVILVAENLIHPATDFTTRFERDRYDMHGDMVPGERTFHQRVAVQLRLRTWRRDPNHQGSPDWHGHFRIKYWGSLASSRQPSNIPSLHIVTEADWRGSKSTTLSFPVNRGNPSITAGHIEHALGIAIPLISAGFRIPPVHIL